MIGYYALWIVVASQFLLTGWLILLIQQQNKVMRTQNNSLDLASRCIEKLSERLEQIIAGYDSMDDFCRVISTIFNEPSEWDRQMEILAQKRLSDAFLRQEPGGKLN